GPEPTINSAPFPSTAVADSSYQTIVTVQNTGNAMGYFNFNCSSGSSQLLCNSSASSFQLGKGRSEDIAVTWTTKGIGTFTLELQLSADADALLNLSPTAGALAPSAEMSMSFDFEEAVIHVTGTPIIAHVIPIEYGERANEAFTALYHQPVVGS